MKEQEYFFSLYRALDKSEDFEMFSNFATKAVIKELIKEEDGMAEDMDYYVNIKDEGKGIYRLADYIREEYIDNCEVNFPIDAKNVWSLQNKGAAKDFLDHVLYSVDCYEVAKTLINRYKKLKGLSNRKGKKDLSLVRKSA